jgi:hypothetical protein
VSRECVPGVRQRAERNRWTVRRSCRHAGAIAAARELGRAAALSAVDDIRHWVRRGRAVLSEITALHRIVQTRLRVDPRTQGYCERRSKEGKTRREIIRSLKRYAAREVFHLVRPVQSQPPSQGP